MNLFDYGERTPCSRFADGCVCDECSWRSRCERRLVGTILCGAVLLAICTFWLLHLYAQAGHR